MKCVHKTNQDLFFFWDVLAYINKPTVAIKAEVRERERVQRREWDKEEMRERENRELK